MWLARMLERDPTFPRPKYFGRWRFFKIEELVAWERAAATVTSRRGRPHKAECAGAEATRCLEDRTTSAEVRRLCAEIAVADEPEIAGIVRRANELLAALPFANAASATSPELSPAKASRAGPAAGNLPNCARQQKELKPMTSQTKPRQRLVQASPRSPQEIMAERKKQAEKETAERTAAAKASAVPAKANGNTVAMPDNQSPLDQYLDLVAPASIVGRMIKFSKEGKFVTHDDGETVDENVDFVALCDQTLVGWIKFNGEGEPPTRHMGLLYDGFVMPERKSLGDNDEATWEIGLDGKPADPFQHHMYLVLQRGDSAELFTFVTSSKTGRRAVGNLLKHYNRLQKTNPDQYPVIKLKVGGFEHRDERVGWVATPVLAVVGRAQKDSAAKPNSSLAADLQDEIPW
jgi:hypothetical protein